MRQYLIAITLVGSSIVGASVIAPQDRNHGTILDHKTYRVESLHDYDDDHDNSNSNDHLNNPNNQQLKASGFSRALPLPLPPPPPPPTSWKWWRYHNPSDSDILDQLLHQQRYNKRERPPVDGTLQVNTSVVLLSATPVRDSGLEVVLVLNQEWFDARLIHESRPGVSGLQLNAFYHLNELWLPELDFISDKPFEEQDCNKKCQDIHIKANGYVKYLKKNSLHLLCKFDIENFPIGIQRCSFDLESRIHSRSELELSWIGLGVSATDKTKVQSFRTSVCSNNFNWKGNFSCLRVEISVERRFEGVWTRCYFPDIIISLTSIFAFCLEQSPCRILVSISTLLTYIVLLSTGLRHPDVEINGNIKWTPLDIWNHTTLLFLFLIFIEFTLINLCTRGSSKSKNPGPVVTGSQKKLTARDNCTPDPNVVCASIIQDKCDCVHYNSVDGSHPNVSLLTDGEICIRCNTCIRTMDFPEPAIDDRMAFQNVFERRDHFHPLKNQATPSYTLTPGSKNHFGEIVHKTFGTVVLILYISFVTVYFSKYYG